MISRKGFNRTALVAALAVTAVVLLFERFGLLDRVEGALLDARFVYGRFSPQPLDERIALVAIDDGSIDTTGRWPWPRDTQAIGIDEIRRAGAEVVAFDILYEAPSWKAAEDEAIAAAIARCEGIVGANSDPVDFLGHVWQTPDPNSPLGRMLDLLGASIMRSDAEVIEQAGLDEWWSEQLMTRRFKFRELAAWLRLRSMEEAKKPPMSLAEFEAAFGVVPGMDSSPERRMLERLWDRREAWMILSRWMPPASGPPSPNEMPPILEIARAAGGVGMVYGPSDRDGQLRRVFPFMPTPGGDCIQLGIAAATKFLGVDPRSVRVTDEGLVVGDRRVPLHDGAVVIDWPTAMFEGREPLGGGGPLRPAVPFAALIELAGERATQEEHEQRWIEVADALAQRLSISPEEMRVLPLPDATRRKVIDNIEFIIPGVIERGMDALPPDPTEEEKDIASYFIAWSKLVDRVLPGRAAVAEGEAKAREALAGKLVFVGFTATAISADMINTPFGPRTPGVYVHAATASMALSERGLRFLPHWFEPTATLFLGALCAFIAAGLTAGRGAMAAIAALVIFAAAAWLSFGLASTVVPMAGPLIGGFGSWVAGVTFVAVISQRDRAKIIRQFRARVSSELVERLTGDPDALSMGGVEREITVLFGDLAGFTSLSEKLGGPEVVWTLNRYMGALTRALTLRRAYVNKFLGDGLLAFWSAFGEEPEKCRLAADAALACQKEVEEIGESADFRDRPRIRLRLGIATGRAVVGDCGAPPDLNDYTAIGDVVNLASRLESANKQFGTSVLIDGATAAGAGAMDDSWVLLRLGRVIVVGQSVPIEVFTLVTGALEPAARAAIETAVADFERGDRQVALESWRRAEAAGAASIAKPFIASLEDPEEPSDGILRLRAK